MRPIRSAVCAAAALVTLAAGSAATAAPAAALRAELHLTAPGDVGVAATSTTYKTFEITALVQRFDDGKVPEPAHEVVVTMDLAALTGVVDVVLPADLCATSGSTATCSLGTVDHAGTAIPVKIRAASGSRTDDAATLRYSVGAKDAGPDPDSMTATRITVGTGPDLVVPKLSTVSDVRPGDTLDLPVVIANAGDRPTRGGVSVMVGTNLTGSGGAGLAVAGDFGNCRYDPLDQAQRGAFVCHFDTDIAPGEVWELARPLRIDVEPGATDGRVGYQADVIGGRLDDVVPGGTPGTGAPLTLVRTAQAPAAKDTGGPGAAARSLAAQEGWDVDYSDNLGGLEIRLYDPEGPAPGHRGADLVAIGDTVRATAGERTEAVVGLRNEGDEAARARGTSGTGPATWVAVEIPHGVRVTARDGACRLTTNADWDDYPGGATFGDDPEDVAPVPTGTIYYCSTRHSIEPGTSQTFSFTLVADRALDEATGLVFAASDYGVDREGQKNNAGVLTVTAEASPGSGGSTPGGSGVVPAGGTGGSLAATGAGPVRPLVAGSAACAALGVLLVAAVRRRARTGG
ncbi:hypothetical protein ACFZAU_28195 [Streptomyces sp. NPDC008238]